MKMYANRLNHDVTELFNHNFTCSGSNLFVSFNEESSTGDYNSNVGLCIEIYEGPYRGGEQDTNRKECFSASFLLGRLSIASLC
jgi:hypothetical protein